MVTFSSKSNFGGPGPGKRRKKAKSKNPNVVSGKRKQKGKYLKNTIKPKRLKTSKTKHQANGRNAWGDLRVGEKIKFTLKGEGKNSVLPNGVTTWTDGQPKPIKDKRIPRAVNYDKTKTAINPVPIRGVDKIDTNPNWRKLQIEKKKLKVPDTTNKINKFIEENKVSEVNITSEEELPEGQEYIDIRSIPDTGDDGLNDLIQDKLFDEDLNIYTSTDRVGDFEKLEEKGKIETDEEKGLFATGGVDEFVKVEDFQNLMNDIALTNPDTDIDPDYDIITLDEIEEYDPDLSSRIQESVPKVTVDGSTVPKEAKLIGVQFTGEENIKENVMIPSYDYNVPIFNEDGSQEWKLDFTPTEFEYTISGQDKGVYATEDGRTFVAPLDFAEFTPSTDDGGSYDIITPELKEKYKATEFEKKTFMETSTTKYTDDIFDPDVELLIDPDTGNILSSDEIDCEKSKKIFKSAMDNMKGDLSNLNTEAVDLNNSELRSYGFYVANDRLYANVAFDAVGLPMLEDVTANFYTGDILSKNGGLAPSIPLGIWKSESVAVGVGGAYGSKEPTEEDLKYLKPSKTIPVDSPRFKSFSKTRENNIKNWMIKNAECYNSTSDKTPQQKLLDTVEKVSELQQQAMDMRDQIANSDVFKNLTDITNKNRAINASMESLLGVKVKEINDDINYINSLKEDFNKNPTKELEEEINGRIDLVEISRKNYKQILTDYNNLSLSDYTITYQDKAGNDIFIDKSNWDSGIDMMMDGVDIETTILKSPNSELQIVFPKATRFDDSGGIPSIISEGASSPTIRGMAMPDVAIENNVKKIDLHDQYKKEKEKLDYLNNLANLNLAQIPQLMEYAAEADEQILQALKDKDTTWAQAIAWGVNRVMGNVIKIIPGLGELVLLLNEAGTRVIASMIDAVDDDGNSVANALREYADAVHNLSDYIATETDKVIEGSKFKPGGDLERFDLAEIDIENHFAGKTVGLLIDITMDIIGTKGLSAAGRATKLAKGIDWATSPTNRRMVGETNNIIIDAYKTGKINKRALAQLVITENMPITIMARLVQDGVVETNELIEDWKKKNPGKEFPLDSGDLLVIELVKPVIEASMDKIGIDFIAGKGVMPKLAVLLTNKAIKKRAPGQTFRQFIDQEIRNMVNGGLIKSASSTAFNVADEVLQEEMNMFIELAMDDKVQEIGTELYGTTEFGTAEHMARLKDVAVVSLAGIGILEGSMMSVNIMSSKKAADLTYNQLKDEFKNVALLKIEKVKNNFVKQIDQELQEKISKIKQRKDLTKEEKKEKIQEAQDLANKSKEKVKTIHDIMQKVDLELDVEESLTQFQLEKDKYFLEQELEKVHPENKKVELEKELENVEEQITDLTNKLTDDEGNIQDEFISEQAQEFDTKAEEFLNKMKEQDVNVVVAETTEEAEAIANENGSSIFANGIPQPALFIKDGGPMIFNKEVALINANKNDGVLVLDFEHEADHFFTEQLEKIAGKDITLEIAADIDKAIANGDIVFKSKKDKKEFEDKMDEYMNLFPDDPVAVADEQIANLRDFMRKRKAEFKKPILDKIKQTINNFVGAETDNSIQLNLDNDGELMKLLDLMAEGDVEQATEIAKTVLPDKPKKVKRSPGRRPKRKTPPSILEPIDQAMPEAEVESEAEVNERFSLDAMKDEKKKLIDRIKDLVADGKAKNQKEIDATQDRIKDINESLSKAQKRDKRTSKNADNVAIIEDPNSKLSAKRRAENELIEDNREPIVQWVVNSKMKGNEYIGTFVTKDGEEIKVAVPRSEIEEGLRSKEFSDIYNNFFKRGPKFKDMPFHLKLQGDLIKRWQQVVDPLVKKYALEKRDNEEGPSLLDQGAVTQDDALIKDAAPIKFINMRQAIGLIPGSDVYEDIKKSVQDTFRGKLPTLESGDLKKALQDAYALNGEQAVRKLIDDMGGVEAFLDTYGEEIYDIMPQSIMNKSFQDFIVKGDRLNVEGTREAESEGKITRSKSKTKETAGNFIYTKEPYNKKKWIKYHTDPKSVGAKGTKYTKKTQLVQTLAKVLGLDATMEVLTDQDVMDMFNERNQLLGQADVLAEEIGYLLDRDPRARFALGITAKDIDTVRKQIMGAVKRAYDKATKDPQIQIDAFDDELELLDPELLRIYAPIFDRLKQLFRTKATGYKKKIKDLIEKAKIPENYKIEARKVNETQTQSLGRGVPEAMQEIHNYAKDVMARLNSKVAKALGGSNFFSYMYGYLDGGDKSRGKGEKFGPYKNELDEINAIVAKLNENEELDFTPEDIRLINATSGILSKAETILDKDLALEDTTDENGKLIKGKRTLLGINEDGTVKPGGIFDQLQKANVANIKAIDYILNKSAQAIAQDNSLIPGFLRWLETMTNNTKSLRALSRLANMEVLAGPQAAFYNPNTGKYKNALSAADKKSGDFVVNYNHPRYNEAEKEAKEKAPNDVEKQQEIIAKKLNYKGEHIDVASNLFADLGVSTLETAAKLQNAKSEQERKGILESFSNQNELALRKYDQSHTTKVEADKVDDKTSTTDATDYIRVSNLPRTPDKVSVSDPNLDVQEEVEKNIITDEEIQEAVTNSIEADQATKESNNDAVEDAGVMEMEGDLTGPEVLGKMATLDAALINARSKMPELRKLRVFDFDDTLAKTNSKVFYTMPDGSTGELTAEGFATLGDGIREAGGEFDFSDFNRVVDPEKGPMLDLFRKMYEAEGEREIMILTARAPEAAKAIQAWLKSEGFDIPLRNIIGLGNSSPQAKAEWFVGKAGEGFNDFYFSDDAPQNVEAVQDVLNVVDVKSQVQQAKERFALDGEKIADRLFTMVASKNKKLSKEALENISDIKAEIKGSDIKENILARSSTQNFTGLLYKFLGKGQEGNDDWNFLKDNLVRPYTRALNELAAIKNTLLADFEATLENFVGSGKPIQKLNDAVPGLGGYTYEDAIRILAWDKQGIVAEGVPKTTMEKIRALSTSNMAIDKMASQLIKINKGDDYYYPGANWRAGTMLNDLLQGITKIKRPKVLAEWSQNIETIFGKDNGSRFNGQLMNAIESTYGSKYRQSFEDMLRRMKSGRNRRMGNTQRENRFYDWLNNSVGAVMFFNMRSGILQTLSAANYINWSFNNPAKAAAAFANQPQYWKDFMNLFNSDFLVDRRGGMKINVSESEIFDIQNSKGNKAKEFLNLLIRKGFSITQIADSFAIASGGATYYRNRIKDLVSKGMDKEEATAQAYEEWTSLSREAQQSSDAMEISSEQAGGLGRVILAFANTPMQYNRLIGKAISDLTNGRGDYKSNISRILYYGAIQNMMFNALQQAVFAAIGNDDPEDLDEKTIATLNGMLTSLMRGMGVAGSIMSAIKDVGLDLYDRATNEEKPRPEFYKSVFEALNIAPPLDVKVSKFVRGMNTYEYNMDSPATKDYFNIENPLYMSGALITASITNLPLDRLLQKMINVKDAMTEEQETWKSLFELAGWSEWQLESKSQQEKREEKESDAKHYYRAIEKPSLYNKAEQEDILRQHGFTPEQIKGLKTQDQRVTAILAAQASSGKTYTSKIPNVKSDEIKDVKSITPIEVEPKPKVKSTPKKVKSDTIPKPNKVNFTENTSFKNNRVPVEKRNAQELKLYELPAAEQKDSLRSLGLSDDEIKALKYEGDRVRKILELQK